MLLTLFPNPLGKIIFSPHMAMAWQILSFHFKMTKQRKNIRIPLPLPSQVFFWFPDAAAATIILVRFFNFKIIQIGFIDDLEWLNSFLFIKASFFFRVHQLKSSRLYPFIACFFFVYVTFAQKPHYFPFGGGDLGAKY